MKADDLLGQARASYADRSWGDAYALFARVDRDEPLDVEDLERFGLAAF